MLQPSDPAAVIEEVAHLALQVGRLLLLNGSDTAEVQSAVVRFAEAFGCDVNVIVTYEALMLSLSLEGHFRTKVGHRVPAMNVGMGAVSAVNAVLAAVAGGSRDLAWVRGELEAVEHQPPAYGRWMVVAAIGLTAASLARLFGADWATMGVVWVAAAAGMWLRQVLGQRGVNPILVSFAAALFSGGIGGLGVLMAPVATPVLCLVAPGMVIVPGVPLINGVRDMIFNHMTMGLARLGFGVLITGAIAMGLAVAMVLTGVRIPVDSSMTSLPVAEDALFSALAAVGYATLFGVPPRMVWACVICGIASHSLRTGLVHVGVDIVGATLLGALAVGVLSQLFARRFEAPAAAFAFPGVVAMVPGAFAFHWVVGSLQIVSAGAGAAPTLVVETVSLGLSCVLMTVAIALGIAAPLIVLPARLRAD